MNLLPFIIGGLTTGSVYGLAGVGLVLTYKASGIFNFANGALATVAAYVFYTLHDQHHVAWPLAGMVAVFGVGLVLGLALEWIARSLPTASLIAQVVATVGLLLMIQSAIVLIYGTTVTRQVSNFFGSAQFHISDATVTTQNIVVFAVALAATLSLAAFFQWTRTGIAMRGVVDNPELLDIAGTNPVSVRRWAWIIGVTFASASGVLVAPLIPLNATTLTLLVVQAFGAAAIGAFRNLWLTYVGGLVIGVGSALCSKYFTTGAWSALSAALPFLILFVVLLVSPRRRLPYNAVSIPRTVSAWRAPAAIQSAGGVAVLVALILVPTFVGVHLTDWTSFLGYFVLFLSLGLLVRTSGQVSLCHVTFLAIGVITLSHLTVDEHWPWFVALLAAGLICVPIGALLAVPAMRFPGLYLALATFGFGILVEYMFYGQPYFFGGSGIGLTVPRPHLSWLTIDSDRGYYYLLLFIAVVVAAGIVLLNRSRLGRLLRALADSPTGLSTNGAAINITRVLVFCLSAFLAGIAGALIGGGVVQVSADSYAPLLSLTLFALIVISVGGDPWYALLAAVGQALIPSYITSPNITNYLQLIFGFGALIYAVMPDDRRGVSPAVQRLLDRARLSRPGRWERAQLKVDGQSVRQKVAATTLDVHNLHIRFGGLVAVDDVSLEAPAGRITGLIGPNGAGKTTTFNACSGLNRPRSGRVVLDGRTLGRLSPSARARRGVGRTFQQTELFDSLSVYQNVALGAEASYAGLNPFRHLLSTRGQRKHVANATVEAMDLCGITELAANRVGALPTGQRRLVELARCLAGPYRILLLDEPSSGLDRMETQLFGEILIRLVRERGVGILLVEHDMGLVTDVCDYVYVLDFGLQIYEGATVDVLASSIVRAAYLGDSSELTVAAAGPADDVLVPDVGLST